jgi:signal peptidase I
MKIKPRYWILTGIIITASIVPSYVRLYHVFGSSDAPTYLIGDRIFVNKVAFDIRIPYTNIVLLSHSGPKPGDVVMFREPGEDYSVFKRVIGCPGDLIVMRDNHLTINDTPLQYVRVNGNMHQATENNLGTVIVSEMGFGASHKILMKRRRSPHKVFQFPIRNTLDALQVIGIVIRIRRIK